MTTDYRAELQRLVKAYDDHGGNWPEDDVEALRQAVERARTALSQPESEGPTDEEIDEWQSHCAYLTRPAACGGAGTGDHYWAFDVPNDHVASIVRKALARWSCPSIEPVLVSERLPRPEDCWPDGHEKVGCCWLWTSVDGLGRWEVQHRDWASAPEGSYTHWLPHYALPTPQP